MGILVKHILRVLLFSVGGLLMTTGLLFILATLTQIPEDTPGIVPVAAIATVVLIVGVCICALAPKLPRPASDLRLLSKEERDVANLRSHMKQHKPRIASFAIMLTLTLSGSVWTLWQSKKLDAMITPEYVDSIASSEDAGDRLSVLFPAFYTLAGGRAKLLLHTYWFAAWTGFFVGLLIIELAGLTKPTLILAMWEKIQRLEREVEELKIRPATEHQHDPPPGAGGFAGPRLE